MVLHKKPAPKFSEDSPAGLGTKEITVNGVTYRMASAVTLTSWKWTDEEPKIFRIDTPIIEGRQSTQKGKEKRQMEPAKVCTVTNLDDGLQYQLVLGKIIYDAFKERYKNDGYVGKAFYAVRHEIKGKRYKGYTVNELTA